MAEAITPRILTEDRKEAQLKYRAIVAKCKKTGTTFRDEEFPDDGFPEVENIAKRTLRFISGNYQIKPKWTRPTESLKCFFVGYHKEHPIYVPLDDWTLIGELSTRFICQKYVPDCGLVAAIMCMTGVPKVLEAMFPRKGLSKYGVYEVRLCVFGEWKSVFVDDWFLTADSFLYVAETLNNQLWVPLIEKAIAKEYGGYKRLEAMYLSDAFLTITGQPPMVYTTHELAKGQLWEILLNAKKSGYPINAGCTSKRSREKRKLGLQTSHAYAVIDVRECFGFRLVRVRNTVIAFPWTGTWSTKWATENGLIVQLMELNGDQGDFSGSSWMEVADFERYFEYFAVCRVRQSWTSITVKTTVGGVIDENTKAIRITVPEQCEVCFSAIKPNVFGNSRYHTILCIRRCEKDTGRVGELVGFYNAEKLLGASTEDVHLEPGTYLVVATLCGALKFERNIMIHSSKKVAVELVPMDPAVLADSLQQFIRLFGELVPLEKHESHSKVVIKGQMLAKWYFVVMAENYTTDQYLHVRVNKLTKGNFVRLRSHGLSNISDLHFDVVPPMSRQILTMAVKNGKLSSSTDAISEVSVQYSLSSEDHILMRKQRVEHYPPIRDFLYMFQTLPIDENDILEI